MRDDGDYPRLVIAGTGGDAGKTLVALGLARAWRGRGLSVAAFKKGPDFIDAAWLGLAAGGVGRNLDTFMMGPEGVLSSFALRARGARASVIEGNRGLHDGAGPEGPHSTAELAKLLAAPAILVLPVRKVTRTAAAAALGCRLLDPDVRLVGVVLNGRAGARHERVVRRAVEEEAGLPVLGSIPRLPEDSPLIGARHLGLVTPFEHESAEKSLDYIGRVAEDYLDIDRLLEIARSAGPLPVHGVRGADLNRQSTIGDRQSVKIGVLRDSAFSFYYPENLEALEAEGAELVFLSPLSDAGLPADLDLLYIGGGFPEEHAGRLSEKRAFAASLRAAASGGLPVYAECGGLVYLSKTLYRRGAAYPMSGVLPVEVELGRRPAGHGYVEAVVEKENPFFAPGTTLVGHEFHYTSLRGGPPPAAVGAALRVKRGTGCARGRDGLTQGSVMASYVHLHALGSPEWAPALARAALKYKFEVRGSKFDDRSAGRGIPTSNVERHLRGAQ